MCVMIYLYIFTCIYKEMHLHIREELRHVLFNYQLPIANYQLPRNLCGMLHICLATHVMLYLLQGGKDS